jgi:DNA repair protein RecN (Recombination protein N)
MITDKLILKSLTLNNFATFDNQVIEFNNSFNTIVGETGSGKSLILDALQLVFGSRADKKIIRKGSDFSTVEAVFESTSKEISDYFNELGHPFSDNEIVVKRIINSTGSSKAYLNMSQCSLSTLVNISKRYIDLVGQFDNQKLLSEDYQLKLLDDYANISLKSFQKEFSDLQELEKELNHAVEQTGLHAQRKDYLEFQINELNKVSPSNDRELELISRKEQLLEEANKSQSYAEAVTLLSDGPHNILSELRSLISIVENNDLLNQDDQSQLIESSEFLDDISFNLSKKSEINHDESELQELIEQLDSYQKLKRKFNCTTSELEDLHVSFIEEFSKIENSGHNIEKLKDLINISREKCWQLASEINKNRSSAAKRLSKDLTEKVRGLRMNGATIEIEVKENDKLNKFGSSLISFKAQTNSGEGYFRVKDIASGGELSRILLSLRQILSQSDTVSVFLFDEIDTGIGGETAVSIGKALDEVSMSSQVIAITHLPQIAKFSKHLIDVNKKESKSRTYSFTTVIPEKDKTKYLQNMAQL